MQRYSNYQVNMINKLTTTGIILVLLVNNIHGQGCSDAGFCSISALKPMAEKDSFATKNQIKFGFSYGVAENSIIAAGLYMEYKRQINRSFSADIRVSSLSLKGNGIATGALSDIFINGVYRTKKHLAFNLGFKTPIANGNRKENNLPLPMDYQPGLGTFDLIAGLNYRQKKINFSVGWQQPVSQNKNEFIAENYPAGSKLSAFQSSKNFERSGDVLTRVSYQLVNNNKINLSPGLLFLYHLKNDRYTDAQENKKVIEGSAGATLNITVHGNYLFNEKNGLHINIGAPVIVRKKRPDGLTRSFVANIEYSLRF